MNEYFDAPTCESEINDTVEMPLDDDRYPGSFFRIPKPPVLGQTGWSLN